MLKDLCFEILQQCPNNCKFCSSCAGMHTQEHYIDYIQFKKVIDYLQEKGGVEEISISGGEPFLHPDLYKMVKLCSSYGMKVNVYTSGVVKNYLKNEEIPHYWKEIDKHTFSKLQQQDFFYISKKMFSDLKEVGATKVVFDFQTTDHWGYNELMGTTNNFSNVLDSMLHAKFAGLYTEIHFIPMKPNVEQIEDILELCDIGGLDRISILKFVPQGRGRLNKEDLQLSNAELVEFCEKVKKLKSKYKVDIRMGIPLSEKQDHLCTAGHNKLSIRYDGVVLPCVAFKEMDTTIIEDALKLNGTNFKVFNIRDGLESLNILEGSNNCALCKQVYANVTVNKE